MNKIVLILSLLTFGSAWSQNEQTKVAVTLYTGISDYYGELNTEFFNIDKAYRAQFGGGLMYYLNPSFQTGIDVGFGSHGYWLPAGGYRANVWKANAQLRYLLANDYLLPKTFKYKPYVFLGTGFADHFLDIEGLNNPGFDWTVNIGGGVSYYFTEYVGINYNLNWAITNNDIRDRVVVGKFNDMFMIHSVGIVFPLGKLPDTDQDGVHDGRDRCPNTPFGVEVDMLGCPYDYDSDGVADYQDYCYDIPGPPSLFGCPDKDEDGIADKDDACPDLPGSSTANGCPDLDRDSIPDAEDRCPDVAGLKSMNGCPDSDGDGITDVDDRCPTLAGSKEMKGCPDSDRDGISDLEDACPNVPGVASNKGCPEIKEETKKLFEKALTGIQFETGKAVIRKTSYSILDNVAQVMKENPDYFLDIKGHTDNQGDSEKNRQLSSDRAESVRSYLISKGIDASRMTAEGFGDTIPVMSNDTKEGRAANRRVEFVVRFEK